MVRVHPGRTRRRTRLPERHPDARARGARGRRGHAHHNRGCEAVLGGEARAQGAGWAEGAAQNPGGGAEGHQDSSRATRVGKLRNGLPRRVQGGPGRRAQERQGGRHGRRGAAGVRDGHQLPRARQRQGRVREVHGMHRARRQGRRRDLQRDARRGPLADVGERGGEHRGGADAPGHGTARGGDGLRRRHGARRDQEGDARAARVARPAARVRRRAQGRQARQPHRRGEGRRGVEAHRPRRRGAVPPDAGDAQLLPRRRTRRPSVRESRRAPPPAARLAETHRGQRGEAVGSARARQIRQLERRVHHAAARGRRSSDGRGAGAVPGRLRRDWVRRGRVSGRKDGRVRRLRRLRRARRERRRGLGPVPAADGGGEGRAGVVRGGAEPRVLRLVRKVCVGTSTNQSVTAARRSNRFSTSTLFESPAAPAGAARASPPRHQFSPPPFRALAPSQYRRSCNLSRVRSL
mmetsp:Transcript_10763/g.44757  ORF Transcript_10763/g.44757 Transcript_10763/m.44757 type:complete len:464 (+) Transcript_10763:472-1863(+)